MIRCWLLACGTALVLTVLSPLASPRLGAAAPARPDLRGAGVTLLQTRYYPNARGGLTFVGVVQNDTGHALAGLDVALTLLAADNMALALGVSGDYGLSYIPPGARLPFSVALPAAPGPWVAQRWQLVPHLYSPTVWPDRWLAVRLALDGVQREAPGTADASWRLVGSIQNTGGQPARLIVAHGALYDAKQRLVDVAAVNVTPEVLAAGRRGRFTLAFPRARHEPAPVGQDVFLTGVRP